MPVVRFGEPQLKGDRRRSARIPRISGPCRWTSGDLLLKFAGLRGAGQARGNREACIRETAVLSAAGRDDRRADAPLGLEDGELRGAQCRTRGGLLSCWHGTRTDRPAGSCSFGVANHGRRLVVYADGTGLPRWLA
jgi:hypothetical protein